MAEKFTPEQWLLEAGFEYDADEHQAGIQTAEEIGMHNGGAYQLHGVYVKGRVFIKIEENTDTQNSNGLNMQINHPQVCVIYGPKGSVAASPQDRDLVLRMAEELA